MSVIKEIRPEDRKIAVEFTAETKTFCNLKVGDEIEQISYKIGLQKEPLATAPLQKGNVNADDRTLLAFALIGVRSHARVHTRIAKVNENYALVVKVIPRTISANAMVNDPYPNTIDMLLEKPYLFTNIEYTLQVDYFILGRDDNGKVFIHYLDREDDKKISIPEPAGTLDPLELLIEKDINAVNKFKDYSMKQLLQWTNREDQGFQKRLQGDIVFKLVEGKKGNCKVCVNRFQCEQKLLYRIQPSMGASIELCEDCIKCFNRDTARHPNMTLMGNHRLKNDLELPKTGQETRLIEVNDGGIFTFSEAYNAEEIERFKDSLMPGSVMGFSYQVLPRINSLSVVIALSGQNVVLEHANLEHKDVSVYIPKNHVGVFTFQRTAPEAMGAE